MDYLFHGTSMRCLRAILAGRDDVPRTYQDEHRSLGGTYFANTFTRAELGAYVRLDAFPDEGPKVVVVAERRFELFPDEDWVSVYLTPTFQRALRAGAHRELERSSASSSRTTRATCGTWKTRSPWWSTTSPGTRG